MRNARIFKTKVMPVILGLSFFCVTLCHRPITVQADMSWPSGPDVPGQSAVVMDINSGAILYEKNMY